MIDSDPSGKTESPSNPEQAAQSKPSPVLPLPYETPESQTAPPNLPAWNAASGAIVILFTVCLGVICIALLAAIASAMRARHSDAGQVCMLTIWAAVMAIAIIGCGIRAKRYLRRAWRRDE